MLVVALTPGQLRRRRDRVGDFLDAWGDLAIDDSGEATGHRRLEFAVRAPGHDLPDEVSALYREYYALTKSGDWLIWKYTYEYLDIARGRRLAYHMHDIGRRRLVPHAHCETMDALVDDDERHQLRAIEFELREAHMRFMQYYASESEPDCEAFFPLDVNRALDE